MKAAERKTHPNGTRNIESGGIRKFETSSVKSAQWVADEPYKRKDYLILFVTIVS